MKQDNLNRATRATQGVPEGASFWQLYHEFLEPAFKNLEVKLDRIEDRVRELEQGAREFVLRVKVDK